MAARRVTALRETGPVLAQRLRQVTSADDATESGRRLFAWLSAAFSALAVISFFAFPPLALVLLPAAIVCLVVWSRYRAADLDDQRLALATELVDTLAPDISDKTPAALDLRHGDMFQFGRVTNYQKPGSVLGGQVSSCECEDIWFSLRGRFRDRTAFRIAAAAVGKRKSKAKRKYTRINDRIREKVTLSLRLQPEEYPHLERLESCIRPDRLNARTGMIVTALQVRPPLVRVTAVTGLRTRQVLRTGRSEAGQEQALTAEKLISVVACVYAALAHCREAPAAKKGPSQPPVEGS
jgi:hypothetical protein